jgi:serine protease Do
MYKKLAVMCLLSCFSTAVQCQEFTRGNANSHIPGANKKKELNIKIPSSLGDSLKQLQTSTTSQKSPRPKISATEIAKIAEKSAGDITMSDGFMSNRASGFFVAKGIIATNHHVIELGITPNAKIWIGNRDNKRLQYPLGKVLADDPVHDVALVEAHESTMFHVSEKPADVAPLVLSNYKDEQVGDNIFIYGNPAGLSNTFSKGIISSFRDGRNEAISTNNGVKFQYDAAVTHGSSGGPIFNERGEVIGIVTSGVGEANLNFGTPTAYITALLRKIGH